MFELIVLVAMFIALSLVLSGTIYSLKETKRGHDDGR
jgi:hypothetical protein